ncbi:hypothetical protein L1887_09229 [Cichorium endivia]|nr:hypothetical protein L1887_09229 [Cichorium endivia]
MDKLMRFLGLLLFLVAPVCCLSGPPSSAPLPKYTVHLKDKDLNDLVYRCVFLEELNDNTLQPGQETKFEAYPGLDYVCHFKWQSKEKDIKVFAVGFIRDCVGEFDKDCIWEARDDGFWFYDNKDGWSKMLDW